MIERLKAFGPIVWIASHWQVAVGIALALTLSHVTAYCVGRDHGGDSVRVDQLEAELEARDLAEESAGTATAETEIDDAAIAADQKERDDAIRDATAPGDALPGALTSHACVQLQQAGRDISKLPACRSGPGRTEADPD